MAGLCGAEIFKDPDGMPMEWNIMIYPDLLKYLLLLSVSVEADNKQLVSLGRFMAEAAVGAVQFQIGI